MRFCPSCGKEVNENAAICLSCGAAISQRTTLPPEAYQPNTGMAVLGFFIPIVGLILYLSMKDSEPGKAKSAGKGALIGACVSVGLAIIGTVIGTAATASLLGAIR